MPKAVKKASPKKAAKAAKSPAKVAKAAKSPAKKVTKRAKKDPNAPKRGQSAYMLWLKDNRARLTKPGMSIIDVTKAAGAEWATVKDKSKYEKAAAADKARYEKEMAAYKAKGGAAASPKKAAAKGKGKK